MILSIAGSPAFAQSEKAAAPAQTKVSKVVGSQMATILNYGFAGGVLGLSTLSFYGRPQDKLAHIPIGMALGIIVGTVYSTSQMVTEPLNTQADAQSPLTPSLPPLAFQWTIDF